MTTSRRHLAALGSVLVVLVCACVFAAAGIAGAQEEYPPITVPSGTLVVAPTVDAGSSLSISGDACGANLPVTVTFNGSVVATTTTDAAGHFQTAYNVPAGTAPGSYTVTATSAECTLSAQVQVLAETAGRSLAFTGSSDTPIMLWVAGGLVVLGAAFVVVARRRQVGNSAS